MEVFLGVGLVAGEIFRYNRQNFAFDQDQRFRRDELRLKMQVERFRLFRQDIRDLVELTVGKMDLYHMVGALFIRMISIYYSEGFFEEAPPIFLQAAYYLSQACALVYLLMAIWLSMHASIKSHSYATRLLTRFVRLPIPGCDQLDSMNSHLSDCETQAAQMLRVPFLHSGRNSWKERSATPAEMPPQGNLAERDPAAHAPALSKPTGDELEDGEFAYGGEHNMLGHEELLQAVEFRTRRHVQLFRQLQARWQCFDAYSRVCMSLGVRHMLQSINYYLLGLCMVQMYSPVVGYMLTAVFQALASNITILDVHGLPCLGGLDLSFIGFLPAVAACVSLTLAQRENGELVPNGAYPISVAIYPLEIAWFELLHWVASPASDSSSIPRHFRAVLFMDVFGEAEDPTEIAMAKKGAVFSVVNTLVLVEKVQVVHEALRRAQAAMRRWEEVPGVWLTLRQRKELEKLSDFLRLEMAGLQELLCECDLEIQITRMREWPELSSAEQRLEHCAGTVLGPFHYINSSGLPADYYWDIENTAANGNYKLLHDLPGSARVLTLEDAAETVREFQHLMDDIRRISRDPAEKTRGKHTGHTGGEDEPKPDTTPRASAIKGAFTTRETKELYKPVRLPWRAVSCLTRTIQIIWLGVGVTAAMRESSALLFDHQVSYIVEERRLQEVGGVLEELKIDWPYGAFLRIEAVKCIPCEHAREWRQGPILVSTPFAHYALHNSSVQETTFEEELFCGSNIGCLAARRLSGSLMFGASRLDILFDMFSRSSIAC
ncbi:unnamed protein product [Symbiodinium natans]|uniref:Uncharacterized protein n=1 Tax=Symbiodinium natans TaxID=878477 RepID=A0A812INI9_9DINO|nr:unnamed protein product [Symbiodinium natans]